MHRFVRACVFCACACVTFNLCHSYLLQSVISGGSRIFPRGGRQLPKWVCLFIIFAENCMKMKEFGPPGGARVPGAPPWIRQWLCLASYHVFSDNLRVTDHAINTLFVSSHAFTLCIQNHSFLITTTCKVTFPIFSVMLLIKTEIITTHLKNKNIGCIQIKLTTGRVNLP